MERNYDVYFELYGKKMKVTVMAPNEDVAKKSVIEKIKFHKVTIKPNDAFNKAVNVMDDILNILT